MTCHGHCKPNFTCWSADPLGPPPQTRQRSLSPGGAPCHSGTDPVSRASLPTVPHTWGTVGVLHLCSPTPHSSVEEAQVLPSAQLSVAPRHFDDHFDHFDYDAWAAQDMSTCGLSFTRLSGPRETPRQRDLSLATVDS